MKENSTEHYLIECKEDKLERKELDEYLQKKNQVETILQADNDRKVQQLTKRFICWTATEPHRSKAR